MRCLLDTKSKGNRRQTREQAFPNDPQSSTDSPESQRQEEGTGREEEEEKDQEGETGSEGKLTTLATWAVLGRFEWSRAKIVYSERKAGSAIIPASI